LSSNAVAAPCGAALHTEHRSKGRLPEADHRFLADVVEGVAQSDRRCGLAFASGCWGHRGDENQLAVLAVLERIKVFERDLGLGVAIRLQVLLRDSELLERHFVDALHRRGLGDFDIGRHECVSWN
jgi:hypothetical protein